MKEYVLKFVDPQVTIQEEAKENFKTLMSWSEEDFMNHVFVRLSQKKDETLSDKIQPGYKNGVSAVPVEDIKTFVEVLRGRTFYASTNNHKPFNPDVPHGGGEVVWLNDVIKLMGDALCTTSESEDRQ